MTDTERAVTGLENLRDAILNDYIRETDQAVRTIDDALELLKEQDERLRKLQKDKDNLCLEISKWKHKFHDAPQKFVPDCEGK